MSIQLCIQTAVCACYIARVSIQQKIQTTSLCVKCYVARLLIQLGIQITDWVGFSGKSVLCNGNVFMSDSMVCSICSLSSQFNYVFKPRFIV